MHFFLTSKQLPKKTAENVHRGSIVRTCQRSLCNSHAFTVASTDYAHRFVRETDSALSALMTSELSEHSNGRIQPQWLRYRRSWTEKWLDLVQIYGIHCVPQGTLETYLRQVDQINAMLPTETIFQSIISLTWRDTYRRQHLRYTTGHSFVELTHRNQRAGNASVLGVAGVTNKRAQKQTALLGTHASVGTAVSTFADSRYVARILREIDLKLYTRNYKRDWETGVSGLPRNDGLFP